MDVPVKILIVDDDVLHAEILGKYLNKNGYTTKSASDGIEMFEKLQTFTPDLVILDIHMPGKNGLELAAELRKNHDLGLIFLTGSEEHVDRIVGLEIGADDYISKPFDERELLARIRSVVRRLNRPITGKDNDSKESSAIMFSNWVLDLGSYTLKSIGGNEVQLTTHEFKLLSLLVKNRNRVLSRDFIMENMKGVDWNPSDRSVDVLIVKLRKIIEENHKNPKLIKTIRGAGYIFTQTN